MLTPEERQRVEAAHKRMAGRGERPWPKQPRWVKAGLWIVGVLVGLAIIGAVFGDDETEPTGERARVSVVEGESLCLADAGAATIHFRVTLRNSGADAATVSGRPWRRYSDNTVNDSILDELEMRVPAGETVTFRAELGYNAEEHRLIECGIRLAGDDSPVTFAVVT